MTANYSWLYTSKYQDPCNDYASENCETVRSKFGAPLPQKLESNSRLVTKLFKSRIGGSFISRNF